MLKTRENMCLTIKAADLKLEACDSENLLHYAHWDKTDIVFTHGSEKVGRYVAVSANNIVSLKTVKRRKKFHQIIIHQEVPPRKLDQIIKGIVRSKISRRYVKVVVLGETLFFTRTKSDKIGRDMGRPT